MKANAKQVMDDERALLDGILERPPTDRSLDYLWAADVNGPSQRALAWRIFCRGGSAQALAGEIPGLTLAVSQAREDLEAAKARLMRNRAAELAERLPRLEGDLADRRALVEAAGGRIDADEHGRVRVGGGWASSGTAVLKAAVGQAQFELREATGKVAPYRVMWPPIPNWEKAVAAELKAEQAADAALKVAIAAHDAMVALFEADHDELRKLRARRVAA